MQRIFPAFLAFIILMNIPSTVSANAGTPLMWASILHLFIGNAVIGIIEGLVIAKIFRIGYGRAVGLLVLANYFSAWLGVFILGFISSHLQINLHNFKAILAALVLATYCFTLIAEWPFVALCFRRTAGWRRKSISANFLAQSLTYLLLLAWYGLASGTSFLTEVNIVPASELRFPAEVQCYYISSEDGDVYSRNLSTSREEKIFRLNSSDNNDRLFARPLKDNPEQLEIVARTVGNDRRHPSISIVQSLEGQSPEGTRRNGDQSSEEDTWFNIGKAPRLGIAQSGRWNVSTGFWSVEGMNGKNEETGQQFHLSLETPFLDWPIRNAVHLPQDMILFQLGRDQICVLEIETKKIALVTKGRGPVAILVKKPVIDSPTPVK